MGQETRQVHHFSCMKCGEDVAVALNVDYEKVAHWVEALENAEFADREDEAPIINLEANFLIPEAERHVDGSFSRMQQLRELVEEAEKKGPLPTVSFADVLQGKYDSRPHRRSDFAEEWKILKKALSLYRRGHNDLAQERISAASEQFYQNEPLSSLPDWLWRFSLFVSGPKFDTMFRGTFEVVRPILGMPGFVAFVSWYAAAAELRADRYFQLMKSYFEGYDDFGQVHFLVTSGMELSDDNSVSSINFDSTRMFYGDAFETFSSSVDILAYLNNLKAGRPFDEFENLTQEKYLKLDKASRFDAFASVAEFAALCEERDNQIRNASHHGGMKLDRKTQTILFRAGKGGTGPEQRMKYSRYLARSTVLFLQAMTLLRLELLMCRVSGMPAPV